jgi:hypothetical protein
MTFVTLRTTLTRSGATSLCGPTYTDISLNLYRRRSTDARNIIKLYQNYMRINYNKCTGAAASCKGMEIILAWVKGTVADIL